MVRRERGNKIHRTSLGTQFNIAVAVFADFSGKREATEKEHAESGCDHVARVFRGESVRGK